jgi:hypothetical protein
VVATEVPAGYRGVPIAEPSRNRTFTTLALP